MPRPTSSRLGRSPRMRRAAAAVVLAGTLAAASACGESSETTDAAPTTAQSPSPSTAQSPSPSTAAESPAASGSETGSETAVRTIAVTEEDFSISLDEQSLSAGSYEIEVVNAGRASHDLVVERDGKDVAATEILSPGDSGTVTVDLEPGEYIFYCSVGAHRSMGMEITVEVT